MGEEEEKEKMDQELYNYMKNVSLMLVIDHSRAGNGFFKRIFDQHEQVLSIISIGYLYGAILDLFGSREKITGTEAYEWTDDEDSPVRFISKPLTPQLESSIKRIGNSTTNRFDFHTVNTMFLSLLKEADFITRKDLLVAIHFAYAVATGIDVKKIKYILLDDATSGNEDRQERSNRILNAFKKDFSVVRVVHLVRDPRACFSSLRHQFVNMFTMYPYRVPRRIWKTARCNSVLIWILKYTTDGFRIMMDWQEHLDNKTFLRVKNEDLNLNFVETMNDLCDWLDIDFDSRWAAKGYVPTSEGVPWKGISAYSSRFTSGNEGAIENDPGDGCYPGPNKYVTERWKDKLWPNEARFVEAVYYNEMRLLGYECDFVRGHRDIFLGLLNGFLLFRGEIPRIKWWSYGGKSIKEFIKRLYYVLAFVPSYLVSRAILLFLYFTGFFGCKTEEQKCG